MFAFPPNRSTGKPLSCGFPQRRHEVGADEQPRTSRASVVRLWPGALPATSLPRHLFVIGRENSAEQEPMKSSFALIEWLCAFPSVTAPMVLLSPWKCIFPVNTAIIMSMGEVKRYQRTGGWMFLREPLFVANGPALTHSILLVEHHMADVDFLMRMIEIATSYSVVHASTSLQALQALRTCKPRLLLLDDELPDRTGLEFCQQLRTNNELVRTPIILFTFTARTANAPHDPFTSMRKPFGLRELIETMQGLLQQPDTLPQLG